LNGYGKKEYNHYGQILAKGYLPNKLLFTRAFDEYDKNGNIISEYTESLDTVKNKWLKDYTLSRKYDSLNNMYYQDVYEKSGDSLTLYYKVQIINKYDNNGHIIEYIGQSYDPQNNEWVNRAKVTMKYKGDSLIEQIEMSYNSSSSNWTNVYKWDNMYWQTKNDVKSYIGYNYSDTSWVKDEYYNSEYGAFGQTSSITMKWLNNKWNENYRDTTTYDSFGNGISYKKEAYSINKWKISEQYVNINKYDDNNNVVETIEKQYNTTSNVLENYDKYVYYNFVKVDFLGIAKVSNEQLKIYPNPVNENLCLNLKDFNNTNIEIFNVTGQKIYTGIVTDNKVNVSEFKEGLYFGRILSKGNIKTFKFIKN
ncbi:MAG: T9SS type A sorting domain-containing protein, partial [Bacteroidota bacterium]|nr:T9SS type A sorting domain-containing protein [Bacteroidota bacterium]